MKYAEKFPGPDKYNVAIKWVDPKTKNKPKSAAPANKNTYIDIILREGAKNKGKPGPGQYNIRKTEEQIKKEIQTMKSKKIKGGEKLNYLDEVEYSSNQVPGPGNYNPRVPNFRPKVNNNTEPKDWIKKHNEQDKTKEKKAKGPEDKNFFPLPAD
jgi:hypothetical protein